CARGLPTEVAPSTGYFEFW
nr:immunoglobulin heavy chain junction region [Macaca mulatta]MOW20620.1 immunoglobulin heavy chain junction region [Macaca mulatta]MOW20920.1 immunoglobulin heavy chain junction region [Macaca mulatta]